MNLYVHIPFCSSKCAYCAFVSVTTPPPDDFVSSLFQELAVFSPSGFRTVYVGGGTPSVLSVEQIKQFRRLVPSNFDGEFSVEVNPGSLTLDKAAALRDCGVNRVSVGVQSFDANVLAFLGRTHSVGDIHSTIALLRKVGFTNIGLDLIAAIPDVPCASFVQSVDTALSLETQHLSIYTLSIEEGTLFAQRNLQLLSDDEQLDQLAYAEERSVSAGFNRYEISNYAKPGFECAYNLAVWRGEDYLGIGPSAASRLGQSRHTNPSAVEEWKAAIGNQYSVDLFPNPPHVRHCERGVNRDHERSVVGAGTTREAIQLKMSCSSWIASDCSDTRSPRNDGCGVGLGTGLVINEHRLPITDYRLLKEEDNAQERFLTGLRLSEGVLPPTTSQGLRWKAALERLIPCGIVQTLPHGRYGLTPRGREVADAVMREVGNQ